MNLNLLYAINKAFEQGKEIHLIDGEDEYGYKKVFKRTTHLCQNNHTRPVRQYRRVCKTEGRRFFEGGIKCLPVMLLLC